MNDEHLIERLDLINEKLATIDKTLAVNTEILNIHIKRSEALELLVQEVQKSTQIQLDEALLPIKTFKGVYSIAKTIAAIGAAVSALSAIIWGLLKLHQ